MTVDEQTRHDFDRLAAYVRDLADMMGLRDWIVNFSQRDADDQEEQESCASQFVPYGTQRVNLEISPKWQEWEPEDLRVTLVHELVHCHTVRMMWSVNIAAHELAKDETLGNIITQGFNTDQECAVEAIATAWANCLPLFGEGDVDE